MNLVFKEKFKSPLNQKIKRNNEIHNNFIQSYIREK